MILITGGAGYIGSVVARGLLRENEKPVLFDTLPVSRRSNTLSQCIHVVGSVTNRSAIDKVCDKYKPDAVIHLAANTSIEESDRCPEKYFTTNVEGTQNTINAMLRYGCSRIIFASSAAVYKKSNTAQNEMSPVGPLSFYGKTKLLSERHLKEASLKHSLNVVILRLFNVVGQSEEVFSGGRDLFSGKLLPSIYRTCQHQQPVLTIYGDTFPTPDGTSVRDYVHVRDVADAMIKSLRLLECRNGYYRFNIGSGSGTSTMSMVHEVEKIVKAPVPYIIVGKRRGEVGSVVSDIRKARSQLGWSPFRSSVSIILESIFSRRGEAGDISVKSI